MNDSSPIALLSVTDKTGLVPFAKGLEKLGFSLLSTGGTAQLLRDNDITVFDVAQYADSPEIMDGRVKTLHPKIHGGILMDRNNSQHRDEASQHSILPIDLVVVNLYQFESRAAALDLKLEDAINFVDIGGPTMLRAAAKNYLHTAPVVDPNDYDSILGELNQGPLKLETRRRLAGKVFAATAKYDAMIANYYMKEENTKEPIASSRVLPLSIKSKLRYGENPHQTAGFYGFQGAASGLQDAVVLQGKELSYNNYIDIDAATNIVMDLPQKVSVSIIKHTNPCGVSASDSDDLNTVFKRAFEADSKSAFGGIVATNATVDQAAAETMVDIFLECIAAPKFSEEALKVFSRKKNLRLLQLEFLGRENRQNDQIKSIRGGILIQTQDEAKPCPSQTWETVTKTTDPSRDQDLVFAMTVCKHVKSNAIVFAKDLTTSAIGAGQMSRIDSANFAAQKAKEFDRSLEGTVLASDAFFPFRDTVDSAAKLGVKAIIQPGGSKRDQESIDACDENGISMVFTGKRHFKH
ncbi:MAG: bifunctional phosphoribosylaminoimidazolecarboxamide formyltransferase/IMP cyclohydrolase [Pseudobacteriovorax sp.]|nr:bifunctional phosphoribosylaminoimidazolecarboxamide formyltransferase/IMP cyclohydrolase [Pseudobacteriovorax sp.]